MRMENVWWREGKIMDGGWSGEDVWEEGRNKEVGVGRERERGIEMKGAGMRGRGKAEIGK